jgi:hypothetical protein
VNIERSTLVDLLRSRNSHNAARRAARSLPRCIDVDRDRKMLLRCGIDPNVLEYILSMDDRVAEPTELRFRSRVPAASDGRTG